jgi:Divergent InlB B-repeat domain/NHL repeat
MRHHTKQPSQAFRASTRAARRALAFLLPFALLLAFASSPAAAQSHTFLAAFGSPGAAAGQLSLTAESGLAVDQSSGSVYLADTGNHRVDEFSESGAFLAAFGWGVKTGDTAATGLDACTTASGCQAGFPGHGPGQFEEPTFIAVDNAPGGSSDLYVADLGSQANERQTVTVSATGGTYRLSFTTTRRGTTTSGSNLVAITIPRNHFRVGDAVSGPGIPAGTTITALNFTQPNSITLSANATASGTAVLAFTETTAAISSEATAAQVQAALEGLGSLEEEGISVSGAAGGPYTVEFTHLSGIDLPQMTADSSSLSGAAATATVATAVDGFNGNRVEKFDPSGNLIAAWGGAPAPGQLDGTTCLPGEIECPRGHFQRLQGVLVKPEGILLVLNTPGGSGTPSFTEWTQAAGEFVYQPGTYGAGVPIGIAVDPVGHVYLGTGLSPFFAVIQTSYCNTEDPLGPCPEQNAGEGYVYHKNFTLDPGPATGVAVDPSTEAVYVARYKPSTHHSEVSAHDSLGNELEPPFGGNGEITQSAGIAASGFSGSEHDVYLADKGANRIEIFAPGLGHTLTLTISGTGLGSVTSAPAGISCPSLCSTSFPEGEALTLTATPPAHSTFLGWSGGGCAGAGPCQITLTADTALTATFAQDRPTLTAAPASAIARHSATLTGTVNPEGDASSCRFLYGPTAAYGSEAPCSPQPGSGEAPVEVEAQLFDLAPATTYHYRLLAANSGGATAGEDQTFTTLADSCATNAALCLSPPTCTTEPSLCPESQTPPPPPPKPCRKGFVKRVVNGKPTCVRARHRRRHHKRHHH